MSVEVIWFEDRFSIKGQYLSVWLHTLKKAGIEPIRVARVNLHRSMHGQLLTKYGTRKAPTWRPERGAEILANMERIVNQHRDTVKAVVLASPESLVATGLDPYYATLGKLRGAVYEVAGVPAIVTLPMSAWFTQVSQKDIAVANYGLESEEEMKAYGMARVAGADSGGLDFESGKPRGSMAHSANAVGSGGHASRSQHVADDGGSAPGDGGEHEDFGGDSDLERSEDDSEGLDDDEDNFYYVPVMTPVGKVMITFDMMKLGRYVNNKVGDFWLP